MRNYLENQRRNIFVYIAKSISSNTRLSNSSNLELKFRNYFASLKTEIFYDIDPMLKTMGYKVNNRKEIEDKIESSLVKKILAIQSPLNKADLIKEVEEVETLAIEIVGYQKRLIEEIEKSSKRKLYEQQYLEKCILENYKKIDTLTTKIEAYLNKNFSVHIKRSMIESFTDGECVSINSPNAINHKQARKMVFAKDYSGAKRYVRQVIITHKREVNETGQKWEVEYATRQIKQYADNFINVFVKHLCDELPKLPADCSRVSVLYEVRPSDVVANEVRPTETVKPVRFNEPTSFTAKCTDIKFASHVLVKLQQNGITPLEVEHCIKFGQMVESNESQYTVVRNEKIRCVGTVWQGDFWLVEVCYQAEDIAEVYSYENPINANWIRDEEDMLEAEITARV
ncbi:MAG: hypothetical protein BEN18_04130 [Epulopiscium sp. Nuni2H_MBin001]|nr:MAG: hypothetical protein BEN18_04130 [Epulopiscium sp. Nuni2H_MBin001]